MSNILPQKDQIYYHFKHDPEKGVLDYCYKILGIGLHTETEEKIVIYKPLYTPNHLTDTEMEYSLRPLSMFLELVDKPEQNYQGGRFYLVTDEEEIAKIKAASK